MSFLDDLTRSASASEPKHTTVPEWTDENGKPWEIYAREPTVHHLTLVDKYGREKKSDISRMAMLACLTFRDVTGKRLIEYQECDKFAGRVNAMVLLRVLGELDLLSADDVADLDFEGAEGNSETTAGDVSSTH